VPQLGAVRLADLSSVHVKAPYECNGNRLSRSMQARVHVVLRATVNFALEEGALPNQSPRDDP